MHRFSCGLGFAILTVPYTVQAKEAQMQEWRLHARRQQHLTQGSQVEPAAAAAVSSTDEVQSAHSDT